MNTETNVKRKARLRFPTDEVNLYLHNELHQNEDDNSAVKAFNKSEELLYYGTSNGLRKIREYQYNERLKYRHKEQADTDKQKPSEKYSYHIRDKPTEETRNTQIQKRQIKKQYAKEVRERLKEAAQKVWCSTKETAKKTTLFVVKHWKIIVVILLILLVLVILFSAFTSVLAVLSSSFSSVVGSTYNSADSEIISAENKYVHLESELQSKIDSIENTYIGYDEYIYDVDEIKHDPYVLTSILSALYFEYKANEVQSILTTLFKKQYMLTINPRVEIRYKTETRTGTYTYADSETGEIYVDTYEYEVEVPYEYKILNVTLENTGLENLPIQIMNKEQLSMYELYMQTLGNRPELFSE